MKKMQSQHKSKTKRKIISLRTFLHQIEKSSNASLNREINKSSQSLILPKDKEILIISPILGLKSYNQLTSLEKPMVSTTRRSRSSHPKARLQFLRKILIHSIKSPRRKRLKSQKSTSNSSFHQFPNFEVTKLKKEEKTIRTQFAKASPT